MMGCWWSNRLLVVLDLFVQPGIISGKLCWHLWLVATPADPAHQHILFSFHSFCFHSLLQASIHYTSTPTTKDDTLSSVSVWMLNTLSIKWLNRFNYWNPPTGRANPFSPLSFLYFESSFFLKLAGSNNESHLCKILHCSLTDPTGGHPASGACASGNVPLHPGRPQPQPFPAWPLPLQLPDLCKTPHHHIVLFSVHSCFRASGWQRPAPIKHTGDVSEQFNRDADWAPLFKRTKDIKRGVFTMISADQHAVAIGFQHAGYL